MNIENLPDDCLLGIIDQLPLKHAFSIRVVNRRWNRLILTMCRTRKNLFLFGSFRSLADYSKRTIRFGENAQWDVSSSAIGQYSLIITQNRFTESFVQQLLTFFPNIQKLVFFYYNWPGGEKLQMLLEKYRTTLISLTVHGMPALEDGTQNRIWTAITGLPRLTRFHIFATNRVVFPVNQMVPLFARLEHFTLVDYFQSDSTLLLAQLGPHLKALILDNVQLSKERLETVIQKAPFLAQSLTHLFIGNVVYPIAMPVFLPAELVVPHNNQPIPINNRGVVIEIRELPWPGQMHQAINRRRVVNAKNPANILEFICIHFEQLKHVDVAYMMINGKEVSL